MEDTNEMPVKCTLTGSGQRTVKIDVKSLDLLLTPGCYAATINHNNEDVGLPFSLCGNKHYFDATLIVTESNTEDQPHKNRLVGQTLIVPQCNDEKTHIYTRTLKSAENIWLPWSELQQNVEVGNVTSLDGLTGNGVYSGTYVVGSSYENFVLTVIDNSKSAEANGKLRYISQFKYAVNVDGTFSYKTRVGSGDGKIEWGCWVDLGAADTTDIQDNSITAQKLSNDVREKVEQVASLCEMTNDALQADTVHMVSGVDNIHFCGRSIDGNNAISVEIPAATTENAGLMSAEDKKVLDSLFHTNVTLKTDFVLVETPARIDNIVKASTGFAGYRYDLQGLYSQGFRYIRFKGSNYTLDSDIVRGLIVNTSGTVENSIITVTEKNYGWEELPITDESIYLKASYTRTEPSLYGELFEPEYVELVKSDGEVVRLRDSVSDIERITDKAKLYSFNLLNPDDLLIGYSLSEGQLVTNANGIFSNKLYFENGKTYTIKDVSTFQHGTLENNATAIFIAKFDASDTYLGRDSIKPAESPLLSDGYVTVTYTPTDESVAYYRVLLQTQSNLDHPYDASRAMIYEGTTKIETFIPYNPIPVFAYDKIQDEKITLLESKVTVFESESNIERFNLLNPNDLLTGYSLSGGNLVTSPNGIFSNKLNLVPGKTYTIKDVPTFQYGTVDNNAVTILVAKFDNSDVYLGRDSIKPAENPTLGDGYVTVTYTPADETVAYYRVLLQSGSNQDHLFDVSRAMIYEGNYVIEDFVPYNPTLVFNYDKVQDARITLLESKITDIPAVEPADKSGGILLTGASFAYSANSWFAKVCASLNKNVYNKAISGESIRNTAVKMHNGTLYSKAEFEDFDVLLIMHVHNQNVCDETELKDNYADYSVSASMSYSQAYDYVLKKYAAECYAAKDDSTSKWYGTQYGKPCKVVCMTHWHDARSVFNDSIRRLREKWGFGLVELDKQIGFSKNQVHPVTNAQVSVIHAQDTEVIDGVTYGWHPSRATGAYIQDKIAEMVVKHLGE